MQVLRTVSPRPGGEADKFGNRYEGRWVIRQLLDVLAGRAASIVLEEVGEGGVGVEFALLRNDGTTEAHQVKRQRGNANGWSIRNLNDEDILVNAAKQVGLGRQFHFVSLIPSRRIDELADRARRSDDLQAFIDGLGKGLGQEFNAVKAAIGTAEEAFAVLQGMYVRWPDERDVRATNAALAGLLVSGAPGPAAAVVLGDLTLDNLGRTLDARTIRDLLTQYELTAADLVGEPSVATAIEAVYEAWRSSIERELLQPEIPREVAGEIVDELTTGDKAIVLASGAAGGGKSAVLYQAVARVASERPVLALRLDRVDPFSSTHELGVDRLGLPSSPVASLAAISNDGPCLLVVDQLDAVSRASGRMPETFDAVAELLREAAAFPAMRVLLACRQFDIDNDDRLRRLVADEDSVKRIDVPALGDEQVDHAVASMGLDPSGLVNAQREILRSPLHLVLLSAIADEEKALSFATSKELFDAFWDRKRRDCRSRRETVRFADTIGVVVDYMSDHQRLVAPESILDAGDFLDDADVLASEHVLVRAQHQVAFFHESFFDYAFARRWIVRGQSLVEFLKEGEQELFRRAQVRQVLTHLRDEDPDRFIAEAESLLAEPGVRFHLKEVVLAILRALPNPTSSEWQLIERLIDKAPSLASRLYSIVRTASWFERLDDDGVLAAWLAADDRELEARALEVMIAAPDQEADRLAELLSSHVDHPDYAGWIRWVTRFSDLERSRALLDLVLAAVRAGDYDDYEHELWMTAHALGKEQPDWACELAAAWLIERERAMETDADGRLIALKDTEYGLLELIQEAAAGAPTTFSETFVPYVLDAMAATSEGEVRPVRDGHFGYRTWNAGGHDVGDALRLALAAALRQVAQAGDPVLDDLLPRLSEDDHDGAQWLLYEALIASGATRAEWAAELLLQDETRLSTGYTCSPYWTTRSLLEAVGPHVSDESFARLEQRCMAFAPDWETPPGGYSEFTLLSGLPEKRLSREAGLRLRELRRRFGQDQPDSPMGIRAGFMGPPIPESATPHMSDEDWLRAVAKHNSDEHDWSSFTGGAQELARLLEAETQKEPDRFAALALRLDATTHPAYLNGILQGLGNTETEVDPERVFAAVRHAADLGRTEHDRWIPWAIRRLVAGDVSDDVILLVLDRALNASDPADDAWQREATSGGVYYGGDPWENGMNTARGEASIVLGDLLVHDSDGHRTGLVVHAFDQLAADPVTAVRTCVAHVLAAGLRHARDQALAAFSVLVDTDDRVLATDPLEQLLIYVGYADPSLVLPVIDRMLKSPEEKVREAGGRQAAFAALELGQTALLGQVAGGGDPAARRGAAYTCAHRVAFAGDADAAHTALVTFFNDQDHGVRKEAAKVAGALRGQDLRPHDSLLRALIDSPTFPDATTQLLFTLERATERVDELVLLSANRFIALHSGQLESIATAAAGEAKEFGDLVLRAYAQATDAEARRRALDLVDALLQQAAYGFPEIVKAAER